MPLSLPGDTTRWRCAHCGNLTRFDVTRTRRTEEFWHMDLSGIPTVEQVNVEDEEILRVRCRWCGADDGVREVPRPDSADEQGMGGTP